MNKEILGKLKKLIRHERSAREIGSLHEAEVFAEKIQQLCDQYNLSVSEIDVEEIRSTVGAEASDIKFNHHWQRRFGLHLADLHGCHLVSSRDGMIVIGNAVDRLILIEVYDYFEDLAQAFAGRYIREYQSTAAYKRKRKKAMHTQAERSSFCLGFVIAIVRRFREQRDAAIAASQNSTALIYIGNKLADAHAWTRQNLVTVERKAKPLRLSVIRNEAFHKGHAAGDSVALTTKTVRSNAEMCND